MGDNTFNTLLYSQFRDALTGMATVMLPQLGQQTHDTTNWKLCLLCQNDGDQLVVQPRLDSYHTLLAAVQERAVLRDGEFVQIHNQLQDCTQGTLQLNKAIWHRMCYANTTKKSKCNAQETATNVPCPLAHTPRSREAIVQEVLTGASHQPLQHHQHHLHDQ